MVFMIPADNGQTPQTREDTVIGFARAFIRATALAALGFAAAIGPAHSQNSSEHPWMLPDLLAAAKTEGGTLTVYSSVNEQEALPFWKVFEQATGIKVEYVRGSDSSIMGRIAIERRAGQKSWDILASPAVLKLPQDFLQKMDLPEAKSLIPQARDPNGKWFGIYSTYTTPAYNTKLVKAADLPKTYEEFLTHKEWAGKVAIDGTDSQWLKAILTHYGEERGRKLVTDIVATLQPVVLDGHLVVARAVAAGEYAVALNNYVALTMNMKIANEPTDIWVLDPVTLFFGAVGVNGLAAHPKTAMLAANFMISKEAGDQMTVAGRLPVRPDVTPNPPDTIKRIEQKKIIAVDVSPEEEKKWLKTFQDLFKPR
jgi:iron(III) transport system substrate-binding protein